MRHLTAYKMPLPSPIAIGKKEIQNLDPQLLAIVLSKKCNGMREKQGGCENCPFYSNGENCVLKIGNPREWSSKIP